MSFQKFFSSIINDFFNFFDLFANGFNIVIENNFVKLLIYIVMFDLLIILMIAIFQLIHNVFSFKKEADKDLSEFNDYNDTSKRWTLGAYAYRNRNNKKK